jgi:hypothetical protein
MTATAPTSTTSAFLASLQALGNTLKTDLIAAAGKPLLTAALAVEANPTVPNVIAQKVVIAAAVIGAVPTLESEGISAVAGWLVSEITPLIPTAPAAAASNG